MSAGRTWVAAVGSVVFSLASGTAARADWYAMMPGESYDVGSPADVYRCARDEPWVPTGNGCVNGGTFTQPTCYEGSEFFNGQELPIVKCFYWPTSEGPMPDPAPGDPMPTGLTPEDAVVISWAIGLVWLTAGLARFVRNAAT